MGALSRLTGDSRYEAAALRALRKLWSMRSSLNLVGTTLDVLTGKWIEYSSGIGAGTTLYIFPCDLLIMCLYPAVSILSLHNILLRHNNDSFVSCLQELIHFMSIWLKRMFFSEAKNTGICFIQLTLQCRSISDMAHGAPFYFSWHFISANWPVTVLWLYQALMIIWHDRYHEADMRTGEATHWQLTSLQAFWPGLQVCWIP